MDQEIIYKLPFRLKNEQYEFVTSKKRYTIYSGGVGGGKTIAGCYRALMMAINNPRSRGLIGTATYDQLRETVMHEFIDVVCPPSLIAQYKKQEKKIILTNESEILFRSFDKESKLRSLTLGWFYIEEATTVKKEFWLQLISRLRQHNMTRHHGFLTTNPDSFTNWVWEELIKKYYDGNKDIDLVLTDTFAMKEHLPEGYIESMKKNYSPKYFKRMVMGEWGITEFQVFDNFDRNKNVKALDIDESWEYYYAYDFGYVNPTACLFIAVGGDIVYVFDEYYRSGLTISENAENIKNMHTDKEFLYGVIDPSAVGIRAELNSLGFNFIKGKNDVDAGINACNAMFNNGELIIDPKCKNTIRELESYQRRPETERPEKKDDHTCDALRYFVYTIFNTRFEAVRV